MTLTVFARCLLASIKTLGKHLCSHCHVRKENIHMVGNKRDMWHRRKDKHMDNNLQQSSIKLARKMIFEQGVRVDSQ